MSLSYRIANQICIIEVDGELTADLANKLTPYCFEVLEQAKANALVINLEKTSCINSAGIGTLMMLMKRSPVDLAFCQLNTSVYSTLKLIQLNKKITIFNTEEEAFDFFKEGTSL
ncbi:MAG: STAS domain-containing protein [SAR324 cluster bacterium]|nr:STAS domain-containing protein [SAR324 cluster bacterium]